VCLIKHQAMKTYGGVGIAPRILNLGTRWRWLPLSPGRFTPLDRRLDDRHSSYGRGDNAHQPLLVPVRCEVAFPGTQCVVATSLRLFPYGHFVRVLICSPMRSTRRVHRYRLLTLSML